jgi:hypothetical protein
MLSGKQQAEQSMPQYTIELLNRPIYKAGGIGFTFTNCEVAQFADKVEAAQRAKELYKTHEIRAIGWRVLDSVGKLVGIGLSGA